MNSLTHNDNISAIKITHISIFGIWIVIRNKKIFMSYDDFPWFKDKSIYSIINVEEPSEGHLFWPYLEVDLTEESIEHPERFPLKSRY